jgi:hypothetical protein
MAKDSVLDAIENMSVEPRRYDHTTMEPIFVSNDGDDKNDGKTRKTAIHSLKKVRQLWKDNSELRITDGATRLRLLAAVEAPE